MATAAGSGLPVCVTVTLIDGLVLARAAMHHSVNFRSVVVLGDARVVADPAEKLRALRCDRRMTLRTDVRDQMCRRISGRWLTLDGWLCSDRRSALDQIREFMSLYDCSASQQTRARIDLEQRVHQVVVKRIDVEKRGPWIGRRSTGGGCRRRRLRQRRVRQLAHAVNGIDDVLDV